MLGVVLALLSFIAPGCIFFPPVDDALEPNDTTDEATVLPFDAYVQGRAVEDNPDVFKMTPKAGESVNIDLRWLNEGSTGRNTL